MIMRCSYGFFEKLEILNSWRNIFLETNETISDMQEEFICITLIFIVGQMIWKKKMFNLFCTFV